MNTILRKGVFWLPSLAAIAVLGNGLSAVAQTVDITESSAVMSPNQLDAELETSNQNLSTDTTKKSSVTNFTEVQQFPNAATHQTASRILTPVPGTVTATSVALTSEYVEPISEPTSQPSDSRMAQSDIDIGRPTRGGRSYIGVAGNIGISGGTSSLGDGNFAVISKVGLANAISVRPSAIFGDNTTVLIPVTYDFSLQQADPFSEPLAIAPYVGVGAAIQTGDNSQVAVLVSGGIDVPLNSQFTATAAVNAGFFDETDIGLLLGVGYNFTGF
ncbi:hypothetical protein [Nostoc sp. MG11]|uniref:hypothetical protein n=1 Tax=Nostoc sp. MG11 TaxID=2721166 RepID=UPI0018696B7A|nr:hypothetical protein [Nostoc sp. MG11]